LLQLKIYFKLLSICSQGNHSRKGKMIHPREAAAAAKYQEGPIQAGCGGTHLQSQHSEGGCRKITSLKPA
jgi:hypothetical protein